METKLVEITALAIQGDANAQFNLGVIFDNGDDDVPTNEVEAAKWYTLAAKQGHADAQFNLGVMYDNGDGVAWNAAEAIKWYTMAAKQGHKDAEHNLDIMYREAR